MMKNGLMNKQLLGRLCLLYFFSFCFGSVAGCTMSPAQRDSTRAIAGAVSDIGKAVAENRGLLGLQNEKVGEAIDAVNQASEDLENSGGGIEDILAVAAGVVVTVLAGPRIGRIAGIAVRAGAGLVAGSKKK